MYKEMSGKTMLLGKLEGLQPKSTDYPFQVKGNVR